MIDMNALRKVFQPKAVAETLTRMEPVPSVLTQVVFADKSLHPMPVIGIEEITQASGTLPLVRYGENPVELDEGTLTRMLVEPEPIAVKKTIRPREIALLKALEGQSLREYARNQIEYFKRKIETTINALCGLALSGNLSYPIKTDIGTETYEFTYGNVENYTPSNTWDTTTANPIKDLDEMMTALQKKNVGGPYIVLAGTKAYQALLKFLEEKANIFVANYTKVDEKAKIPYIEYFGFRIYKVADTYTTTNGVSRHIVDPKSIIMLGEVPYKLKFLSLDDIEYGPVALPMLVKTVKDPAGQSISLIAQSKPFPIPKVNAIIKAKVLP